MIQLAIPYPFLFPRQRGNFGEFYRATPHLATIIASTLSDSDRGKNEGIERGNANLRGSKCLCTI